MLSLRRKQRKSENVLESPVTEVPVEVPARHLFVKCPHCRRATDATQLADNLDVCPRCGHHLRVEARRRLQMTVDRNTFEEMDATMEARDFLGFPGYAEKLERARLSTGENDAVICGVGSIGGGRCGIFVMDSGFMMGSMGSVVGEKVCRLFERATELRLPVVGFTVSGGARMQEGTTSLMQMAKVSAAVRRHHDAGLLYVVVLTDPTSGGVTASFAMEGDVCLAEPGALVAFAGPRVVEQTVHRHLPPGFQRAEFQLEHGFVDQIVPRSDLPAKIAGILALHGGAPRASLDEGVAPSSPTSEEGARRPADATPASGRDAEPAPEGRPTHAPEEALVASGGHASASQERDAYQLLQAIRSADRPTVLPLIGQVFDGFEEMHGDRLFGDDAALVAGIAWLGDGPVTVIGTERGSDTAERVRRNFGSAHPEGYRKALRLMRQAESFGRPVVCLVDTSGAYCGVGAEERGQGEAIASNLMAMSALRVPIVTVVVGEGGSGGALALALADRVLMLSGAVYSVVSPEGAASILWKTADRAPEAARALRITSDDLLELGVVDDVLDDEGLGTDEFARRLSRRLRREIDDLCSLDVATLLDRRYARFRRMGERGIC